MQNVSIFWLAVWSDDRLEAYGFDAVHYWLGFLGLTAIIFCSSFGSAMSLIRLAATASQRLHTQLFAQVLHAPISFFDTTPLGRVISRFSHDIEGLDRQLPEQLNMLIACFIGVVGMFISIGITVPWAMSGLPLLAIVYYSIMVRFRAASREMKRLDSIALSPIYAHFQQSLGGISTIRAYDTSTTFLAIMSSHIDHYNRANYCIKSLNRWLSVRLEMLGSCVLLVTGIVAVNLRGVSPGFAGVALSYALQCTGVMNWTVRCLGETEAHMNCAERIFQTIDDTPSEAVQHVADMPPSWPDSGSIVFEAVSVRYRPGLPLVLNSLSVSVESGWRVGVVGRTGCGKSTLLLSLLRLVEPESGHITIGGVRTSSIGLADLRSKLAVVPQDPVLWTGSLRKNLDPFGRYSDSAIWASLSAVGQQEALEQRFPGSKLDDISIAEYGDNFSHGQRQLFCLNRAMLVQAKVVLMDEATSAIDETTDALVQKTLREQFSASTMLIVAHRLRTIADSDRILVLDKGTRAEYDTPRVLLDNSTSHFSKLVNELGPEEKQFVLELADEASRPSLVGAPATPKNNEKNIEL